MATTVNAQGNATVSQTGNDNSKTTIVNSGFNDPNVNVEYHIQRADRSEDIHVYSNMDITNVPDITLLNNSTLKIILPGRIRYRARTKQVNGSFGAWTGFFKSRDRVYTTPDAITQLSDDNDNNAGVLTSKGVRRRIHVTNSARATEFTDATVHPSVARGAKFVNTDFGYVSTTNIVDTARGATVTNSE